MGEFELIRQVFMPLANATATSAVQLGPGDDCAIQRLPPESDLVFSVDTLVEGVHFPKGYAPECLGWRSLATAASDLAAMGADPVCFTLALTLPNASSHWLQAFAEGLESAARAFGLALAGGDTTRGPLALSLQVHGTVPQGQALLRSGACSGDLVCVSGSLGDAGAALQWLDQGAVSEEVSALLQRYHYPTPRLALGRALRGKATAAIDVSDGLLVDLQHLLEASGVGARIYASAIPQSTALQSLHPEQALALALNSGDDYELCFTIAKEDWALIRRHNEGVALTVIGEVLAQPGLLLNDGERDQKAILTGYDHFGGIE
ncbi:thiamine-phosphate kinase [Marinobacter caseinilyticus]|uniref:thiamine-phosphate kinase n=1 Tax=Marinobacter caseinilyticus TaxID=2692195 RepID=UPI00140E220D|nr:thiamine-phosphate kinase [Marinobacter caseinilyticus]